MRISAAGHERYRLLVDSVTDYAIYMLDAEGTVATWNPGARRFKGYEADEIIGQHFSRFYTAEDRAAGTPKRALEIAAREGRYEDEGWRVRKDGTEFWTHVVIDPIRAPDGSLIGFAKITRDQTEKRLADIALRNSEERFRILIQGVTDYAIYMLDADGNVTNWNSGAQRIKQYRADEIVGRHFSTFYTPEDRANGEPAKALKTAREQGRFEKEGIRVRKDGTRFWANVVIDPIRDESGEIVGFAKVTRDITERVEAQRELEKAREIFFQSQKMEAIGQLTGGVAHDFNNLLAVIVSSMELLAKRIPTGDARAAQLLDNAMQGALRGAALTQRMLAFARRQDLDVRSIDVAALIGEIRDLLSRTLGPLINLEIDVPAHLPPVATDANQLELALLNLTVNARDAMPDGGVIRISARAETVAASVSGPIAGQYLCVTIADEGHGMDADTLARAAEPFFTTKGVGKGTGLGLSMVKGFVEQTGGDLRLVSEARKGTSVELWLPVATDSVRLAATPANAPATTAPHAYTVLVVDDDPLLLMNISAMLEDLGHRPIEANSATEAMDVVAARAVDLVITDHAMPKMTGSDLAKHLLERAPNLPIIVATGYAELPQGAELGLPRLAKPYSLYDLEKIIDATMAAKRA